MISPTSYAQLLYDVLQDKSPAEQEKIFRNFRNVLIKKKHTYLAPFIEKELQKTQTQKRQERTAYISSASELTVAQKRELEGITSEPREFSVKPELLGGVAVRKKDKLLNATLRKKIEILRFVYS